MWFLLLNRYAAVRQHDCPGCSHEVLPRRYGGAPSASRFQQVSSCPHAMPRCCGEAETKTIVLPSGASFRKLPTMSQHFQTMPRLLKKAAFVFLITGIGGGSNFQDKRRGAVDLGTLPHKICQRRESPEDEEGPRPCGRGSSIRGWRLPELLRIRERLARITIMFGHIAIKFRQLFLLVVVLISTFQPPRMPDPDRR